jgi:hypothetical protein
VHEPSLPALLENVIVEQQDLSNNTCYCGLTNLLVIRLPIILTCRTPAMSDTIAALRHAARTARTAELEWIESRGGGWVSCTVVVLSYRTCIPLLVLSYLHPIIPLQEKKNLPAVYSPV